MDIVTHPKWVGNRQFKMFEPVLAEDRIISTHFDRETGDICDLMPRGMPSFGEYNTLTGKFWEVDTKLYMELIEKSRVISVVSQLVLEEVIGQTLIKWIISSDWDRPSFLCGFDFYIPDVLVNGQDIKGAISELKELQEMTGCGIFAHTFDTKKVKIPGICFNNIIMSARLLHGGVGRLYYYLRPDTVGFCHKLTPRGFHAKNVSKYTALINVRHF